jgi:hypothetical protein
MRGALGIQGTVELGLVRSESDVFTQLPQKLTGIAGKALGRLPRGHQHTEHPALGQQRRDHQALNLLFAKYGKPTIATP